VLSSSVTRSMDWIIPWWKNQPDLLAGILLFAALGLVVRGRPGLALLFGTLAVAAKEIGYCFFPLTALVILWRRRFAGAPWPKAATRWAALYAGTAVTLAVIHHLAVGPGYSMGTNEEWAQRAAIYCGGPLLSWGMGPESELALIVIGWIAGILVGRRRPLRGLCLAVFTTAAVLAVYGPSRLEDCSGNWSVYIASVLATRARLAAGLLIWGLGACLAVGRARPLVLLGWPWLLIGALPTFAATQTLGHTRWLGEVGWMILWCAVVEGAYREVSGWDATASLRRWLERRRGAAHTGGAG